MYELKPYSDNTRAHVSSLRTESGQTVRARRLARMGVFPPAGGQTLREVKP